MVLICSSHARMWELDYKESWVLKNWCFWTVVLEKTFESPLDCTEIQPGHPQGDQSWVFIERTDVDAETPILWPPEGKSWLIGKDPDAGKDSRREEKGTTENEMVGWHHWLDGHEFDQTSGNSEGQGSLCAAVHGVAKSRTTRTRGLWIITNKLGLWIWPCHRICLICEEKDTSRQFLCDCHDQYCIFIVGWKVDEDYDK